MDSSTLQHVIFWNKCKHCVYIKTLSKFKKMEYDNIKRVIMPEIPQITNTTYMTLAILSICMLYSLQYGRLY